MWHGLLYGAMSRMLLSLNLFPLKMRISRKFTELKLLDSVSLMSGWNELTSWTKVFQLHSVFSQMASTSSIYLIQSVGIGRPWAMVLRWKRSSNSAMNRLAKFGAQRVPMAMPDFWR